jgi:hypothetical protein
LRNLHITMQTLPQAQLSVSRSAPSRQIILAADGSFTDAPGSYATANATASARIQISE